MSKPQLDPRSEDADYRARLGGRTHVHSLTASHSPFYSQPKALADLLAGIAG